MEITVPLISDRTVPSRFTIYAWFVTLLTLGVILWGAYVRASRSGDGCGAHWPLCNGAAIPSTHGGVTSKIAIEYAHRVTSGLDGIFVIGLVVWAFRRFPRGHLVRRSATLSTVFIATESLIGAGLVLLGLVGQDASVLRAIYLSVHLTNTFILIAAMALTAWGSRSQESPGMRLRQLLRGRPALALAGAMVLSVSGAIAALGATLFPASVPVAQAAGMSPASQLMFSLKEYMLHPLLAVLIGGYLISFAVMTARDSEAPSTRVWAARVVALTVAQFVLGLVNATLLAPIWLQILHLLLANLIWISLVLLCACSLAARAHRKNRQGRLFEGIVK